jgi:peptidoglycan/LPS O-acetylase OafA/YrhL
MWVVLFHFGEGGQIRALQAALPSWLSHAVFTIGDSGVPVFFVLSGFVIAHSIGEDRVTGPYVGRFVLRRAIRLDLPYWLAIGLTIAFAAAKATVLSRPYVAPAGSTILAHMFYLHDLLRMTPINPVFWTLCFEIQFYLLFCALLWIVTTRGTPLAVARARAIVFGTVAIVSLVWPLVPALQLPGLALSHWHGFLLGVFVCWMHRGVVPAAWPFCYIAAVLILFGITRDPFTLACACAAIFITIAHYRGALGRWLGQRLPQFLGRISYSLYLIHVPVSGALFVLCYRVLGRTPMQEAIAAVLVLLGNCVAAAIFWRVAERPSTALARRIRKSAVQ